MAMATANGKCSRALGGGLAVLLARLVDRNGACIRRSDVSCIEFSLYEIDPFSPGILTVVHGQSGVGLPVADVMFDSLQTGGEWSLDRDGYNFRHDFQPGHARAFPKAGVEYELQYRFTARSGQTIVRFRILS